jgi:phage-related holin
VENAGLMGIPMPPQITKAIEILTKKSEEEHRNEEN